MLLAPPEEWLDLNALNETWLLHSAEHMPEYCGLLHPMTLAHFL